MKGFRMSIEEWTLGISRAGSRWLCVFVFFFALGTQQAMAVGPQKGVILTNTLTVDYQDSFANPRPQIATNTDVLTLATFGFSLTPSAEVVNMIPGETIALKRDLSDSSNTFDSFTITFFMASGSTVSVQVYEDANANDTLDLLTDTLLASGDSSAALGFDTTIAAIDTFFVYVNIPNTAANGTVDTLTLVAVSNNDPTKVDTITIEIRVASPALTVSKEAFTDTTFATLKGSGSVGETVVYLITILNDTSASQADTIVLFDTIPGATTFVASSIALDTGVGIGFTAMTDAIDADEADFTASTLRMQLGAIPPGRQVRLRYIIRIGS